MMDYAVNVNSVSKKNETLHRLQDKDFWVINGMYDNSDELQAMLDTQYNTEIDCYSVGVVECQNVTKLVIKCNLCNTDLRSSDPFLAHNDGKNHKKLYTQFCEKGRPDEVRIISTKSLRSYENNFEPGTLEYNLSNTSHVTLGWQFLYRKVYDERESYSCQLCSVWKMNQDEAFDHILSEEHTLKYMEVKFRLRGTYEDLYPTINNVVKKEGKIASTIFTLNKTGKKKERGSNSSSERSFVADIEEHFKVVEKGDEEFSKKLAEDKEGQELLIQTVKVISQKLHQFVLENNEDIWNSTDTLMKRADHLRLTLP